MIIFSFSAHLQIIIDVLTSAFKRVVCNVDVVTVTLGGAPFVVKQLRVQNKLQMITDETAPCKNSQR